MLVSAPKIPYRSGPTPFSSMSARQVSRNKIINYWVITISVIQIMALLYTHTLGSALLNRLACNTAEMLFLQGWKLKTTKRNKRGRSKQTIPNPLLSFNEHVFLIFALFKQDFKLKQQWNWDGNCYVRSRYTYLLKTIRINGPVTESGFNSAAVKLTCLWCSMSIIFSV